MKRGGGFTLVELLIVVMIIGILAGMVLLAMGPVLDNVEATRIINDLRNVKGAAMTFYLAEVTWPGSTAASIAADAASLEKFLDRDLSRERYAGADAEASPIDFQTATDGKRVVGLLLSENLNRSAQIQAALAKKAAQSGITSATGGTYTSGNPYIPMN